MDSSADVDRPVEGPTADRPPQVSVHVLSEYVFCPRAAILALESGEDSGEEEPRLGPRLDTFADYDEHRFVEELQIEWGRVRLWLTLTAPALLLAVAMWRIISPLAGLLATLPMCYVAACCWQSLQRIIELVRERAIFRAAVPATIDFDTQQIRQVNWWSLRKAGFDCFKPVDPHFSPAEQLTGRPWRILTKGTTLRIPVIRKHQGERVYRPQHIVRIAAYCRLIETCEGADSPFGILMFAGSYDCLLVPANALAQSKLDQALREVRDFLRVTAAGKYTPTEPQDTRCRGCHWGEPRRYIPGESETILHGEVVAPFVTRAANNRHYCRLIQRRTVRERNDTSFIRPSEVAA